MRVGIESLDKVHAILKHPEVYPFIGDDLGVEAENFDISSMLADGSNYFLMPSDGILALLQKFTNTTYTAHINIVPEYRGQTGFKAGEDMIEWMFSETDCLKIVAFVPSFNKRTLAYAKAIGFKEEGLVTKAFLKYNILHDMHVVGIMKEVG